MRVGVLPRIYDRIREVFARLLLRTRGGIDEADSLRFRNPDDSRRNTDNTWRVWPRAG